jgi:formylglycine-generating enzyme required for sulfatase activity
MSTVADSESHKQTAAQTVNRFVRRFDESYLLLAYHASLPLVLTPELVNYLRNQFLRGERVPWVAEVDLLLSDLCSQVGYELYAMDTHMRAYLIEGMQERYGQQRMQEVGQLLISYVKYLSQINPGRRQPELEAQRWAAMVYLGDESCKKAVQEIVARLIETSSGMGSSLTDSGIRAELARLVRITEELSPQLKQEQSLLEYARLLQRLLKTPDAVTAAEMQGSFPVGDVELKLPDRLLPDRLKTTVSSSGNRRVIEGFPPIQTFEFEEAIISIEPEIDTTSNLDLQPFEFEVATIESKQTGSLRKEAKLVINRRRQQAWGYSEDLGNDVQLEMVAIPEGSFMMGSPEAEEGDDKSESPQHHVTVKSFLMGKYPVTQAQWQAVAALPQINRKLKPDPSMFKGANRPVEQVSWLDAVEFCDRLSQHTSKPYRLPSEAEWEYACRAGTITPFHFGETITTDLANYDGNYTYGAGSKGVYRQETTPVGSFGVANAFGLYDMHGNVWEWCADHWHSNYEGAPNDGSAWVDEEHNDNKNYSRNYRLLRGGSWDSYPRYCRSAIRSNYVAPDLDYINIGFRIVCVAAWTL